MGKLSLGLGLAVGYVLGAQAGRERYEQIRQAAAAVLSRPDVQQALDAVTTAAPAALRPSLEKLTSPGGQGGGTGAADAPPSPQATDAGRPARSDGPLPDPLVPPAKTTG